MVWEAWWEWSQEREPADDRMWVVIMGTVVRLLAVGQEAIARGKSRCRGRVRTLSTSVLGRGKGGIKKNLPTAMLPVVGGLARESQEKVESEMPLSDLYEGSGKVN